MRTIRSVNLWAGLTMLGLQLAVVAWAAPPAGVSQTASVEGVTEYRLANGLRVLLYPDLSKQTVTVNVTYLVGSRMESYGETGMAHLLEHLMFKGSTRFPNPDREFAARGFRNNGSTGYDRTNYFSTFQASDDNLSWALRREADAMTNSFIARKDLDSEMTVVRNEYEKGENDPIDVLFKRLLSAMFQWHAYGKETIGARSDIEDVRIENLRAFYRIYYQPDNAVLIIAGHFDVDRTLRLVVDTFGRIPRPKRALPPQWTVEPTQDGEHSVTVRRKGDSQIVLVGYHIPAGRSTDTAALSALSDILGETPSGRLHHELVESGLAAQVFAEPMFLHDPGVIIFGAIVKPGDSVERVRERLIDVVEHSLGQTAPTQAEMDRMRRSEETEAERALADPQGFGVVLSDYIAQGDWRLFFLFRDATERVDAPQVVAASQRYLRRDNRTVGIFLPEDAPQRAEIPTPLPVDQMLKDFKPRAATEAGERFDPSPQNIDARTRLVHAGDLKIALLPKKTKGGTVNVSMAFRFGDLKTLNGQVIAVELTRAMLGRGTANMTRQQIDDELTRLKVTGDLMNFQASRATVADALKLVESVLQQASFPAPEFDQLKREMLTGLQSKLDDPSERSRDALLAHFSTYAVGDPRRYIPLTERIEAVKNTSLADVQALFDRFWGTARGDIALVGDFDPDQVDALVVERFGSWKSKAPYQRLLNDVVDVAATRIFIDTTDKENAVYRARIGLDLRDDDPDAPALALATRIIGGGSGLHNRLVDRIRQKDGLSYGIGAGLVVNGRDRAASWGVGAIAAPQNVNRVEQEVREELERVLRDGFTDEEVQQAKQGYRQERVLGRSEDGALAAGWVGNLDLDRTYEFSRQFEAHVDSVTAEQLLSVVRKYLDLSKMTVVVAGDAKKGAH
jgi:zinc protease